MVINFGALNRGTSPTAFVDPRDIFGALASKPARMNFLRGPQDQVLEKWFARRDERDLVIKLNTGGGKTLIGLLVAQSALAEAKGPVAYLVPDRYLVEQVEQEARELGLQSTSDPKAIQYAQGKAILVDTFQRLFNGKSVFGVGGSAGRQAAVTGPATIIVDDAHACLNKAEQVFRLTVPCSRPEYDELLRLFADVLEEQSPSAYLDLVSSRNHGIQQVPFWAWADRQHDVMRILHPIAGDEDLMFSWPLLADVLGLCRAVFTADALEIEAPCLPADKILGFASAKRRVYLTATLADDGVLITHLGANTTAVSNPITPANAGDIGDRLILVPQQTHPDATQEQVRDLILDLARDRNVAVIVPSDRRAGYWAPHATAVLNKDNLSEGVAQMREDPNAGLFVLVNRYDGIDLPGDACHVLVVDGLPEALTGVERIDHMELAGSEMLVARQVQRLEQGMGRATRSNDDYCVVFLLGDRLAERLYGHAARSCFSPATRAQLELSEQVAEQLEGTGLESLREVALQCLGRDKDWVAASRAALAPLRYGSARVGAQAKASRAAFDDAAAGDTRGAVAALQPALDATTDPVAKGYLLQQLASYQHHYDPVQAQQSQIAANRSNRNVLRPRTGVAYEKLSAPTIEQGAAASGFLQKCYGTGNELVIGMKALVADLMWGPRTGAFEQAWSDLADHLGFAGQRPERDTGRGPDGLWALGASFLVCEAKSDSKADHPVYKSDAEQLSNSMDWFRSTYGSAARGVPIIIHPNARFDNKAAVPTGCRVVTIRKLEALRVALHKLIHALSTNDAFRNPTQVGKLLASSDLTGERFVTRYTSAAIAGA